MRSRREQRRRGLRTAVEWDCGILPSSSMGGLPTDGSVWGSRRNHLTRGAVSFSLKSRPQLQPFNHPLLSLNLLLNSHLPSNHFNVSIFRRSLCHPCETIRLLLCSFSGPYFPPKHYGKNIRSASGFFIADNPFVKIPGFPFKHKNPRCHEYQTMKNPDALRIFFT